MGEIPRRLEHEVEQAEFDQLREAVHAAYRRGLLTEWVYTFSTARADGDDQQQAIRYANREWDL